MKMNFKLVAFIFCIFFLIIYASQEVNAQKIKSSEAVKTENLSQELNGLKEKLDKVEKNSNPVEQMKQALTVSSDTVKYVGTIATIVLTLIIFLIGYQVIRSHQFEKEIKETRKLMMDEYQKMLDIRTESEKCANDTKSKMANLERLVGDVATEFISKKASDLVKKEVKEQTAPVFEEMKTKDEDMNKSIELMKKIEALDLTLTPSVYVERGKIYLDQGNMEKSIDNFNKAIEFPGVNFDAIFYRGLANHRMKQFDEAINDYMEALKIKPKELASYANIGACYREKKEHDYEKSIHYLTEAIKLNPKYEAAYLQRSITYRKMRKYDLSVNDAKQIETLNQKSPYLLDALFQIGLNYGKMGNFDSAIEFYLKRLDKEKNVSAALNLAEAYICKKAFSDAETWANESYALSDTDRDRIMSKFLLITTLILNNKEYKLELNEIGERIKALSTFELKEWSFDELLGCLTDQSIPPEKTELIKKLIALLKKEIKPEDFPVA